MIIIGGADWVEIAAAGAVVQKAGTNPLKLAYSSAGIPPDGSNNFGLPHNQASVMPLVTGKVLWAKAGHGSTSISVELLAV